MKQLREILQTYTIIIFSGIHVLLITRFCVDFFGTSKENPIVKLVFNLSNFVAQPFLGTFESSYADNSLLNYSILYAIIIYTLLAIFIFILYLVIFKVELKEKSLGILNLIFGSIIVLHVVRLVSDRLGASLSPFYKFLTNFTNIFINTISSFSNILGSITDEIAIVISMVILAIAWFTASKILSLVLDSVETVTTPTYKPPKHKPRKLKTTLEPEVDDEKASGPSLQEQVTKPEDYIEPKMPEKQEKAAEPQQPEKEVQVEEVQPVVQEEPVEPEEVEEDETIVTVKEKGVLNNLKPQAERMFSDVKKYVEDLFKPEEDETTSPFEKKKTTKETTRKSPLAND